MLLSWFVVVLMFSIYYMGDRTSREVEDEHGEDELEA